ncbi:hypothetical protein Glove_26g181 [Diversispora epigaea]|uniref:Altered inheritance of mitochondria protein 41 n=1 Tax=Diversispora epigaea TaxID=1348612 RepID=A0A397JT00_9GLOM|nr:hypothetical protein Glove_26g181 [Diversispora epigaea]
MYSFSCSFLSSFRGRSIGSSIINGNYGSRNSIRLLNIYYHNVFSSIRFIRTLNVCNYSNYPETINSKNYFRVRNYSTINNSVEGTETKISPLLIKLKTDVKDALRNKDQVKLNVVRGLLSDVTHASKSVPSDSSSSTSIQIGTSDQDIYPIVNRAIKRHKESIDQFSKAGRMDLVEIEKLELDILNSYLPQPMTEQEIGLEVIKVIKKMGLTKDDGGIKNMGKVMKELNLDIGRAPKNVVAQVVKNALSSNDSY